ACDGRTGAAGEVLTSSHSGARATARDPGTHSAAAISGHRMAYGLYTHIQSNRRRSIALLIGLFLLVYVMTFAGALLAEALMVNNASLEWLMRAAWRDLIQALPFVTIGTLVWMAIAYKFHQKMIDALTGGHEITRQDNPRVYN